MPISKYFELWNATATAAFTQDVAVIATSGKVSSLARAIPAGAAGIVGFQLRAVRVEKAVEKTIAGSVTLAQPAPAISASGSVRTLRQRRAFEDAEMMLLLALDSDDDVLIFAALDELDRAERPLQRAA